jgi:hypothetical protein
MSCASSLRRWSRSGVIEILVRKNLPLAGQGVNGGWPRAVTSLPFASLVVRGRAIAIGAGMKKCAGRLLAFAFASSSHEIVTDAIFSLVSAVGLVDLGGHDPGCRGCVNVSSRALCSCMVKMAAYEACDSVLPHVHGCEDGDRPIELLR